MTGKAKTTNARTRTKAAAAAVPKTNRSHAKTASLTDSIATEASARTAARVPLTNRSNSPERVPSRTANSQKALSRVDTYASVPDDTDREPITVRSASFYVLYVTQRIIFQGVPSHTTSNW